MAHMAQAEAFSPASLSGQQLLLLSVGFLLVSVGMAYGTAKYLFRPIRQLQAWMQTLENGDFQSPVPGGPAEIRAFARAFEALIRSLSESRARLIEGEARMRAVLEQALDAVVAMDEISTVPDWNCRAEEIFGWTRDEAFGRKMADSIIPVQYREAHGAGVHRFLATGESRLLNRRVEITALRADGQQFPVELAVSRSRKAPLSILMPSSPILPNASARSRRCARAKSGSAPWLTTLRNSPGWPTRPGGSFGITSAGSSIREPPFGTRKAGADRQ